MSIVPAITQFIALFFIGIAISRWIDGDTEGVIRNSLIGIALLLMAAQTTLTEILITLKEP